MSEEIKNLLTDKSATATGIPQQIVPAKVYTVHVVITGSVTALTVSMNGGLANEDLGNMVTRDIIAEGGLFFMNAMAVDFMSADIDAYTGTGTVSVIVRATP